MFAAMLAAVAMAGATQEFRLEDARTIYPCYRTWEFKVEEPGLYAVDVVPPSGRQPVRPGIRLWLDGVQIGFVRDATDYSAKVGDKGCFRRIRHLKRGRHSLDLYLNLGTYEFADSMEKAMGKVGIKFETKRLENGEVGFWMPDDCMARVAGEPLVVFGCAAKNGSRRGAETQRDFMMEVRPVGVDDIVWSQTLAIDTKPVRFEYPCDKEGAFKYVVRDDKGEVVEGPWDFVVTDIGRKEQTDLLTPNGVRGTVSRVSDEQIRVIDKSIASSSGESILIDCVDCTEGAGGAHLFRESGKSEIVETPDGAYRQTGPHGCRDIFYDKSDKGGNWQRIPKNKKGAAWRRDFDWFGYTLHVEHPGKTHLLVCKIPNDVRRLTHVFAFDRRTGRNNGWGLDTGDAPAAGPWSELRIPVWPNTNVIDVMVVNTDGVRNSHVPHPNRRGAAAELSLVEFPDGLPALEAPGCGWDRTREFGWDGEQVDLGPNERTMPRLSDEAVSVRWSKDAMTKGANKHGPAHSWADMAATWERTFELEAWRGGTTIAFPVYSYGMVSFQGDAQKIVPPANDRYAVNRVGATCGDPFDRDTFALMLQRAEKHGVKLVADFMVQRTYGHVVEAWARRYGMEDATNGIYLSVSADGRPYKSAPCVYAGMPNPAHPAARAAQIEFCREFGRRYGRYASFGGIKHRFWKGWPGSFEPWFHSADTGFDDFTVGEFSKATGIVFAPVGTDESAFADRKKRIREKYGREWNDWRTQVCLSLHREMLAALREGAPHARFYVLHPQQGAFRSGTGLDCDVFAGRRDFGFDVAQLTVDGPGVEINHLDPATFGHFFPNLDQKSVSLGKRIVPGSLCCNRSYRCSPYHLEPAVLALAENRLDSLWMGGQWCLPPADETLREFVRAYRAIPDRDDWQRGWENSRRGAESAEKHTPVAVWWAKDGDDVLFWAVNRTDANRRVVLHFDKETAALIDCVTGNPVNPVNPVKNNSAPLREIKLSPFMPGVFRAKGAGSLLGFEVPVDPEEAAQIEKDYAFLSSFGARPGCATAVEVSQGTGETYCPGAKALGKRDERWTWRELFAPMTAAHDAGDLFELRSILADFRANHRWWFEAFGWPEDFCVVRNVGRKTLAGFLDFQRKVRPEEVYLRDTNGVETAILPQAKSEFVCVPKGAAMDVVRHGSIGGCHQMELTALFGGGYGDILVEDFDGNLLGVMPEGSHVGATAARLETRILASPISGPDKDTGIRLKGNGEKGLAILRIGFKSLPPKPVREWDVVGPFDAGRCDRSHDGRAVITNAFAPEMGVDLVATYAGIDGKALKWKKVVLGEGERLLDVKALAPCDTTSEIGVAYLHAVVDSPRRRKTAMYGMNDYFGTIWLNGEAVVPEMKGPILGYEGKTVLLKEGRNDILVKTSAGSAGAWVFGLAFADDGSDYIASTRQCARPKVKIVTDSPLFGPPCERVAAFVREARAAYAKPTFANGEGSVIHKYSREDPFGHDPCEDVPLLGSFDDALPRFYAIPGLRNVRDIGGWNGLMPGRVFRGSQLHRTKGPDGISQATRDGILRTMGVRTELDLRGVAEWGVIDYDRRDLADMQVIVPQYINIPFPSYLGLFDPTNVPAIASAVRVFADPSAYPVYVHCAGGADRTGALVMILQALCGATEADIDVDYELTSFAVVFGLRHRDETERLAWKSMKDAFLSTAPGADLSGAVERYCTHFLGLSVSEISSIRALLGIFSDVRTYDGC